MTTNLVKSQSLAGMAPSSWPRLDWTLFLVVIMVAAFLRIIFYTGFFGSDEVTYTGSAFKLLDGDWSVSTYVGANRYGINLPVAALAYLFGRSEFVANLYSLLCSLTEISLVFYFGYKMLGLRAAALAAGILAFLPLHAHFAGRLMADAPLALMITASFLFFWDGETRKNVLSFAIAGLAAGLSFWIKPHAIIYLGAFLVYPLVFWRWNWQWFWMVGAFTATVLGNQVFFWIVTGDFLFLFHSMFERHTESSREVSAAADPFRYSATYYLVYLFIKIYHTWLLAFLALFAAVAWWVRRYQMTSHENTAVFFLLWWSVGLISVFSLFVVSWDPLILIPKQTNYMLMFVAPLALLAGYAIAQLRRLIFLTVVSVVFLPSVLLIAMEQNVIHKFTANSKAAVQFSMDYIEADVYADTSAFRAGTFHNLTSPPSRAVVIKFLGDLMDPSHQDYYKNEVGKVRYALVNTETFMWGRNQPIRDLSEVPSCWVRVGDLKPEGFGLGWKMLTTMAQAAKVFPEPLKSNVAQRLDQLTQTEPAYVYRIPESGCGVDENIKSQER